MKEIKLVIDTGGTPINNLTVYLGGIEEHSRITKVNSVSSKTEMEAKIEEPIKEVIKENEGISNVINNNISRVHNEDDQEVVEKEVTNEVSEDVEDMIKKKKDEIANRPKMLSENLIEGGTDV